MSGIPGFLFAIIWTTLVIFNSKRLMAGKWRFSAYRLTREEEIRFGRLMLSGGILLGISFMIWSLTETPLAFCLLFPGFLIWMNLGWSWHQVYLRERNRWF
ncbi:MAG: hypothetical protein D8M56_10115 [Chloroflexi bacterium]|nr:hypothetical protein [Chloroflexota bacterium]